MPVLLTGKLKLKELHKIDSVRLMTKNKQYHKISLPQVGFNLAIS